MNPISIVSSFFLSFLFATTVFSQSLSKRDMARIHVRKWELAGVKLPGQVMKSAEEVCRYEGQRPSLNFKHGGTFWGGLCCNTMHGRYQKTSDGSFRFTEVGWTAMDCAHINGVKNFDDIKDEEFVDLITSVRSATLDKKTLELHAPSGAILQYIVRTDGQEDAHSEK